MTQGENDLHFFYDASNKPALVVYNGVPYSYVKKLQGDVVAILDASGNVVVSYVYDAWGRPINKTGSMAATLGTVQPFRYRGYVYDEEIGLYYLRSRYFDSVLSRFLVADDQLSIKASLNRNLYTYCGNRVICFRDSNGKSTQVSCEGNLDTDGDGIPDCQVYTYRTSETYTIIGDWFYEEQYEGHVYFYSGDCPAVKPSDFNARYDAIVLVDTMGSNPNMQVLSAHKIRKVCRESVLLCMLSYDADNNTAWNRQLDELMVEWEGHSWCSMFSQSARDIDFDNAEANMPIEYFYLKAVYRVCGPTLKRSVDDWIRLGFDPLDNPALRRFIESHGD